MSEETAKTETSSAGKEFSPPAISLPKGGGAIRGIGEKFAANPVTGTGSMSVPIAVSPGRSGFEPQLSLSYDSGSGNGPFGLGWSLSLPVITRKTDKGLPRYDDASESDVFILSGAEDLVPVLTEIKGAWISQPVPPRTIDGTTYQIKQYRPRIEGLFARIERWTNQDNPEDTFWRSITRDNLTTFYGKTNESRIYDPADHRRIFSWLICESYDDKGNAIRYEYKPEDSANVVLSQANERNRTEDSRSANRYLKRIKYGNLQSRLINPDLSKASWLFEVVFDYGEGHYQTALPDAEGRQFVNASKDDSSAWPVRRDPFSGNRAGFEVRTYRLCRRVLMFHHFKTELGVEDYLVRSTEFSYDEKPIASFITSVVQSGYVRRSDVTYLKKSLPPLEFDYTAAVINHELKELDADSLANLPAGLDGGNYQWIDLDGEGLSGVLSEQAGAWFYKPNLGHGHFGGLKTLTTIPALSNSQSHSHQFLDLAGDGQLDAVQFSGAVQGFYERTEDNKWDTFKPFRSLPKVEWGDQNLRFVDLTGDGHADVLISDDATFTWFPSLAEEGFGAAVLMNAPFDEEKGPRLVFSDATQSIYLADFSGDGLTDLVRIRNGEVCYWSNQGYGRFGPKVTMDNTPWFDSVDQFDPRRIRLADTDGSGTTDILYLSRNSTQIYFNQSGNSWSDAVALSQFPLSDNVSSVQVVDLLGEGTACLVWSSPLPNASRQRIRYLSLMEEKPHLLVGMKNNLGAETKVRYASSTKFYLADKQAGQPWATRLPFPVHVVEQVENIDRISRNRFITRYAYHHGYFDGVEREFRGFGLVEQFDTEAMAGLTGGDTFNTSDNMDAVSHVPPVHTKTWFHTGAYLGRDRVSNFFARLEYYREPGLDNDAAGKLLLDDTVLPAGLSIEEEREACRALKGSMLRQEIYALDGSARAEHPYTVTEQNFTIETLQPRAKNHHAAFFTHPREVINYHYERDPADPRISHALTLEVDRFGNVLKEVAIGYGRRHADPDHVLKADQDKQTTLLITYTENSVTNPVDDAIKNPDHYRAPLPAETQTYELTGFKLETDAVRFSFADWTTDDFKLFKSAEEISYEVSPDTTKGQKRLIEHVRTLYRADDLTALLPLKPLEPLKSLESLGLQGESYKLAFTPGLLSKVYKRPHGGGPAEDLLPNPADVLGGTGSDRGGYVVSQDLKTAGVFPNSDPDNHWWIPSGRVFLSPGKTDTAAAELDHARHHFFVRCRYRDPFDQITTVAFDDYDLLITETTDPLDNISRANNDYRVLQPALITDPNRNRTEAAFDALGMAVATAVKGKDDKVGDSLGGLEPDLTQAQLDGFYDVSNPNAPAADLLKNATTRIVYDYNRYRRTQQANPDDPTKWLPTYTATLARETHASDPLPLAGLKIQLTFSYFDGFGREIQKKIEAEPGPLRDGGPDVSPRWVGSGWTIFNNKGKPVRQYEPFFSQLADKRHQFEFGVEAGVSPILFYDPVGRVVATIHPNDTYEKVVFTPWRQKTYDVNDTVAAQGKETGDPRTDPDIKGYVTEYFKTKPSTWQTWHQQRIAGAKGPQEKSAAEKAALHANTPTVAHMDTLGRPFLTFTHNGFKSDETAILFPTRVELDFENNQRAARDARGNVVMTYDYDMLSNRIHQNSTDAGKRWMLNDVAGKPFYAWDSRDHRVRTVYDKLRRPLESHLLVGTSGSELLVGRTVYGETRKDPEVNNLRLKTVEVSDQAGVVTTNDYDFKGNPLRSQRQFATEYKATLNWPTTGSVSLETEVYKNSTRYDALNRPIELTTPDNSVISLVYNEANLLERVEAKLRGASTATSFVADIDYNAKGQRTLIDYGNGVRTTYEYDPETFRLSHLLTTRGAALSPPDVPADDCPAPPPSGWPGCQVQNLRYTYDPAGNITHIQDDAQQKIYFKNVRVEPSTEYTYDAIYRLIEARGREHLGAATGPTPPDAFNRFHIGRDHPNDEAMGLYLEQYIYDSVGNIMSMRHRSSDAAQPGWRRCYQYAKNSNRLLSTSNPADPHKPDDPCASDYADTAFYAEQYEYDAHGNMTQMPHLQVMRWDYRDQLQATAQQKVTTPGDTPETAWYVYDASGQRVRKVTENFATGGATPTRKAERVYVGGFEKYREYNSGGTVKLERETLHLMDDKQRVALVETRTDTASPEQLIRYQFGNHLGSASLELDHAAQIISYEEYYPYGSTSYQATRSKTEAPKRYRYTTKERDEETGFYYHQTRYYSPYLTRWTAADPIGIGDGLNLFAYAHQNPVIKIDTNGMNAIQALDDKKLTITFSTTVHLYAYSRDPVKAKELKTKADAVKAHAEKFFRENGTGHHTEKGKRWTVRFKVNYEVHTDHDMPVRFVKYTQGGLKKDFVEITNQKDYAKDRIKPGDNLLQFRDKGSTGDGGETDTEWAVTTQQGHRKLAEWTGSLFMNRDATVDRDGNERQVSFTDFENAEHAVHETGHFFGFGERYRATREGNVVSSVAQHPRFANDLMRAGLQSNGPLKEMKIMQTHFDEAARFALAVTGGKSSVLLFRGALDDTHNGTLMKGDNGYEAAQTDRRTKEVQYFKHFLEPRSK